MTRVLITCVGGAMMQSLLSELKADPMLPLYIVGVDSDKNVVDHKNIDKFFLVPPGNEKHYSSVIFSIAKRESIDVIIPLSDEEAFRLSEKKNEFEAIKVKVLVSPLKVLKLLEDKVSTYEVLQKMGIRVPAYRTVNNIRELKKQISFYGYPNKSVIIKPVLGRGGRGVNLLLGRIVPPDWVATGKRESRLISLPDQETLRSFFCFGDLMVMPLLGKPVYDVDVLSINGKVEHIIVRERHNPVGIPFKGSTISKDPLIYNYCVQICEALGLDGLHDIDLMTDANGIVYVLEVNPRPSGSIVASHKLGFPIMSAAITRLRGVTYVMPSLNSIVLKNYQH